MGYRAFKGFGADGTVSLTTEGQQDPALVAAMAVAKYTEAGSKSGSYPGDHRSDGLNWVPEDVAKSLAFVFGSGPVPGSQQARGSSSLDVKLGPEDAKSTVDLPALQKSGYALLFERKFDPKVMSLVASKDKKEIAALASSTGSHLVLSMPVELSVSTAPPPLSTDYDNKKLPVQKKTPAGEPLFSSRNVAWLSASAAAGALMVFLLRKK